MGLISKEAQVEVSTSAKFYEERGYIIPKEKSKWGRISVKRGTKIKVRIEDLPLKYQEIIQLKYFKGLSNLEIAKAMHCSTNSIKAYITRIKKKLKNQL